MQLNHDDVIKWKHFPRNWSFVPGIHRSPVNSPHKGQWRRALMFSLICVWINDWVNNREAGDLRRYRAHSDVIVMYSNVWVREGYRCVYNVSLYGNDPIHSMYCHSNTICNIGLCVLSHTRWRYTFHVASRLFHHPLDNKIMRNISKYVPCIHQERLASPSQNTAKPNFFPSFWIFVFRYRPSLFHYRNGIKLIHGFSRRYFIVPHKDRKWLQCNTRLDNFI